MTLMTWLTLGRVSNLPSVWTNILAAVMVAQAAVIGHNNIAEFGLLDSPNLLLVGTILALSLMYIGGMFLNDAFDAKWDVEHQSSRPIATGQASVANVWFQGAIMLFLGVLVVGLLGAEHTSNPLMGWLSGVALAGFILLYNYLHKAFALAPVLMGMCRFCVYLIAAVLLAKVTTELLIVAFGICAYICGVTYSARNEHINQFGSIWTLVLLFLPVILTASIGYSHAFFWIYAIAFCAFLIRKIRQHLFGQQRNVGAFIGSLLAGIPLLDGLALASMDLIFPSLICLAVFLLMPRLQRWVSAT